MNPIVLDQLRPLPAQPDPDWAAETLRSIMESPHTRQSEPASARRRPARVGALGLAAAAVLAVGGLGVGGYLDRPFGPAPIVAQPTQPATTDSRPVHTDLGPLTPTEKDALVQSCDDSDEPSPVATVHYARRTSDGSAAAPRLAAVVTDERGEYRVCVSPRINDGPSSMVAGAGPGLFGSEGDLTPTHRRPLRCVTGYQWRYSRHDNSLVDVHLAVAYAVAPTVDHVRVRVSGPADTQSWFEGTVFGGFVYIPVFLPELAAPSRTDPDLMLEARAYDADGHRVGTDRQPDLDRNRHGDPTFWRR